jgi:NAD(P)-dependent dehydrogenase (short-subunit alcohol dehydrogenase family)
VTRTVVVTGASSGIGEACAQRLARAGWNVLAGVRREEDAERLRGNGVRPVRLDVTDAEQIRAAAESLGDGALHGLVDNAGIAIAGPLEFLPTDELRRQLEVNVVGQVAVIQAFMQHLRRGRGRVVLVGSIAGRSALPFLGAYAASKHAIEAIGDALRVELRPWGMHVAVVEPGSIATAIWRKGAETADEIQSRLPPAAGELYGARIAAFRRLAEQRGARGIPADAVAEVVEHALTAERPRPRYVVGRDARIRAALELLPTRARDNLLERIMLRGS